VAQVAAGLFTAPVFVLLIERLVYGRAISGLQVLAVAVGFVGVLMVLGPSAMAGASVAAAVPVAAGALYAMGNIATRRWCEGEAATTLVAGFFAMLAIYGLLGMAVLSLWPLPAPPGPEGFVLRGPVVPNADFWFWTFVQAAGSLVAVAMMIRAYQVAQAGRVAVFEYVILPASAFWSWAIWGQRLDGLAVAGMVLIVIAGVLIATSSAQGESAASGA
jgi:drug/metabolite transporter (DMT)-like permease